MGMSLYTIYCEGYDLGPEDELPVLVYDKLKDSYNWDFDTYVKDHYDRNLYGVRYGHSEYPRLIISVTKPIESQSYGYLKLEDFQDTISLISEWKIGYVMELLKLQGIDPGTKRKMVVSLLDY